MTFKTRKTEQQDTPDLQIVLAETELFPPEMLPKMLAAAGEDQIWLTCLVDGVPAALVFAEAEHFTEGTWNMRALAVVPKMQRTGAGRALVAALVTELKDLGQRLLVVDTSSSVDQTGARQFYPAIGFEHEATIRDFWTEGDDKVTYRQKL